MLGRSALLAATNSGEQLSLFLDNTAGNTGTIKAYAISTGTLVNSDRFTIELWMHTTSTADMVLLSDPSGTNKQIFRLNRVASVGKIAMYNYPSGGNSLVSSGTYALTGWNHLAFVCDNGANTVYVNGAIAVGPYDASPTTEGRKMGFLGALFTQGNYFHHFRGYISRYRITNAVRYTLNFTPPLRTLPLPTDIEDPFWSSVSGAFDLNGSTLNKKNNRTDDFALFGSAAFTLNEA